MSEGLVDIDLSISVWLVIADHEECKDAVTAATFDLESVSS